MGIGSYPCGVGPCGHDPVLPPSARSTTSAPVPYYDPAIRGLPLLANGDLASVHPVVQEASLALGVELGSIPAAPSIGLNRRRILASRRDDVQQVAVDEVNVALSRLIAAGDVRVVRVVAESRGGRVVMDTEFTNLRDPGSRNPRIRSTF